MWAQQCAQSFCWPPGRGAADSFLRRRSGAAAPVPHACAACTGPLHALCMRWSPRVAHMPGHVAIPSAGTAPPRSSSLQTCCPTAAGIAACHQISPHALCHGRDGTTKILISTDVLSRGFDVTQARQRANGLQFAALSVHSRSLHAAALQPPLLLLLPLRLLFGGRCDWPCQQGVALLPKNVAVLPCLQVTLVINFDVPVERDLQVIRDYWCVLVGGSQS